MEAAHTLMRCDSISPIGRRKEEIAIRWASFADPEGSESAANPVRHSSIRSSRVAHPFEFSGK